MRPARQRRAQNMRVEAPIGGWNTRDSLDNIPPMDALSLKNWIPDLGEVRTRPGYSEHCWSADVTTGSELVLNPGFETAGGGGADVFLNWTEVDVGGGTITQDSVFFHAGAESCKFALGFPSFPATEIYVHQAITVSASTTYKLEFYTAAARGVSDVVPTPEYLVYDVTNGADIIARTGVTITTENVFQKEAVTFTTPVGCVSVRIELHGEEIDGQDGSSWFDAVSLLASLLPGDVETLAEYSSGATRKLIAATGNSFLDVTTAGAPSLISGKDDLTDAAYKWTDSVAVPGEWHVELTAGGDPGFGEPGELYLDDVKLTEGTLGTLNDHEWAYGDNDTLGYSTVYFADATGDPDGSGVVIEMAPAITTDRWQWVNFDGKIGFVNGADTPLKWDGAGNVETMTMSGSGLDPDNVIGINVFKHRTWFWEDGSQDVWYSALNTLGGACTKFPLSRVGQFGGELVAMVTWTRDGGSGPDDFAVFVMSSGEAIIYQGSSPALAGDWAIVGVYDIGEPLSVRSIVKFGGDIFIITRLDYVNLSEVIPGAEAYRNKSKVVRALRDAIGTGGAIWGWEAQIYPKRQLAIFNHPVTAGTEYEQHVMNTVTGAWCLFTGITSHTWQGYASRMFFGSTDGYIYEFDTTQSDDGEAIESEFQTAWLPLGGYGNKSFIAVREFTIVNAPITTENQYVVDYETFKGQRYPAAITSGFAEWGDPWGTPWTAADGLDKDWETVGLYGEVISIRKRLSTKQRVRHLGSSWLYEPGERL